jgi:outer membrane protein, adhesin transport system
VFSKNQPVSQPDIELTFNATILKALQRNPEIAQNISELAAQNAYINVAKAIQ